MQQDDTIIYSITYFIGKCNIFLNIRLCFCAEHAETAAMSFQTQQPLSKNYSCRSSSHVQDIPAPFLA